MVKCNRDGLSRNQRRAIEALMRSPTVAGAADHCGLSEATLYRYLRDDNFEACLSERQDQATSGLAASICGLTDNAMEALEALLTASDTSDNVTAKVALGVLSHRRDIIELDVLAKRVEALEELVG